MQMKAEQVILSRGLPKTAQETDHYTGDDGAYQAGWWVGEKFNGHKTRFIAKTFNSDKVVIDLATGLMWAVDGGADGCNNGNLITWFNGLLNANALDFAGFIDWRMPNIKELESIVNYKLYSPSIAEPPFTNTKSGMYLSSTTYASQIQSALLINFATGISTSLGKTGSFYLRCVRGGL